MPDDITHDSNGSPILPVANLSANADAATVTATVVVPPDPVVTVNVGGLPPGAVAQTPDLTANSFTVNATPEATVTAETADVKPPAYSGPKLSLPKISLPSFSLPKLSLPSLPSLPKKKVEGVAAIAAVIGMVGVGGYFAYPTVKQCLPSALVLTSNVPAARADDAFVRLSKVKKNYLLATRHDGKVELRTGGNLSWRLNNPGKLVHGDFTKSAGALGSDGKYAVFPNLAMGRKAVDTWLFGQYKDLSIKDAMAKFALKKDGYNPDKYATKVASAAGVPTTALMGSLTDDQQTKFVDAVQKLETYTPGKVELYDNQKDFDVRGN
jgi:hypothetical protein